jgi:hypothetical protein
VRAGVPAVLGRQQLVLVGKGKVVEGAVRVIAEHKYRDGAVILLSPGVTRPSTILAQIDTEQRPPGSTRRQFRFLTGGRIGIAGGAEEERAQLGFGQPGHILGALEWRGARVLRRLRGIEGQRVTFVGFVDRYPFNRPGGPRRVQPMLRQGYNVGGSGSRADAAELQRLAIDADLQRLHLAAIL